MNIKLNQKVIKEMCGTVSFKRGDSFYRTNKVTINEYNDNFCEAVVHGAEDFQVTVNKGISDSIQTTCSCPTLLNYSKCCQHVAAVLFAILERKKQGEIAISDFEGKQSTEFENDFLSIFQNQPVRSSGHQRHFEKREVLDVHFKVKALEMEIEQNVLGIEIAIDQLPVQNIRKFLKDLGHGKKSKLSNRFTYDPNRHCFTSDTDEALHMLIRIVHDEKTILDTLSSITDLSELAHTMFIPPSTWRLFSKTLTKLPFVTIEQNGVGYDRFQFVKEPLPIEFQVEVGDSQHFHLLLNGYNKLLLLNSYQSVLCNGKVYLLEEQDMERLIQLSQMIKAPGKYYVPIPMQQFPFFLEKVVAGLRRLGDVQISPKLSKKLINTPLVAKIYLDRLKNRLLAGVEFHYDHLVIQPLESQDNPMIVRYFDKEEEILHIMEESGFSKTEGGYFMQNEELEYDFLYYVVPKLQELAQIYMTTAVRNRVIKTNTHPKIRVKVHKERTNWLEFKFEMDGIAQTQIKEILADLEFNKKYYRLPNGSLLSLETKEMQEMKRFLQAGPTQDNQYEATLHMPLLDSLKFLDLINENSIFKPEESFRQFLDELLHPGSLDFKMPERLSTVLREYQKDGYKWMKLLAKYGFGGVLADDMGLGKTIQSIAFIVSELSNIRESQTPVLIVCPSSLTYNWMQEIMQFAPELQAIVMDGNQTERQILRKDMKDMDVLITSYPLLRQDIQWYKNQTFHTIFFDEAQAFKNPFTQTARAVKKLQSERRFGLTGTPIENSLEELWSIYHVIFPELFKGLEEYSHLSRKTIADRVRPFLLRRVKEDVLGELPKKQELLERSDLFPEQKKLYAALLAKLREDTLKHLDQETFRKNRIRILAGLTRLRQICCHPALFVEGYKGSSAKFEQLLQILEESKISGRRVLIFSQFTKMLNLIGREMTNRGESYFYLDGQTPSDARVELCNRFNAGERNLFLISLKAGGTGLNLTGADTVILYDLWWNPAVEEQAADRAHRMGQKNEVQVIKLLAAGTIEEKMNDLQEKKRHLIADILNPEEKMGSTLTEEDIRDILMI
ncbi:DEAD/DEAH box helicase [Salirhabdus sp. Marseille-P4669]|uniref:DEAD/DEAH box helicase n=1 Tax=Salirhabdus sp. Marseille-P4669 TaxID=2042310 RepID=UPI000C7D3876|nr:DEAD/DEAH box helicase [Salirhabdus sp. Marseille-P4669]